MDESVEKGLKLMSVNGSDASIPENREIGRVIITGYDIGLPADDVESALRKHFSSCGEITDVYVPINYRWDNTLWNRSFIYFLGEGAVDKALQLNGIDVGGWTVSVMAYPFPPNVNDVVSVRVEGYETSLCENDIKTKLIDFLSSCGNVRQVIVSKSSAVALISGDNAAVEAPKLSGSFMGERKLVVTRITDLGITTVHTRPRRRRYYS